MEVILLLAHNLGEAGDVVKVANGYARNYLFPNKIAVLANERNKEDVQNRKLSLEKASEDLLSELRIVQEQMADYQLPDFIRQAGDDNKLFGSVTRKDIASKIAEKHASFSYDNVHLDSPIKYIGIHKVTLSLHHKLPKLTILVNIARSEQEAITAKNKFLAENQESEVPAE